MHKPNIDMLNRLSQESEALQLSDLAPCRINNTLNPQPATEPVYKGLKVDKIVLDRRDEPDFCTLEVKKSQQIKLELLNADHYNSVHEEEK